MDRIETIKQLLRAATFLVPLVSGLTQVAKMYLPKKRHVKVAALLFGVASALVIVDVSITSAVVGLFVGLAATGLYEQLKSN